MEEEKKVTKKKKSIFRKSWYIKGIGQVMAGSECTTEIEKAIKAQGLDLAKLLK